MEINRIYLSKTVGISDVLRTMHVSCHAGWQWTTSFLLSFPLHWDVRLLQAQVMLHVSADLHFMCCACKSAEKTFCMRNHNPCLNADGKRHNGKAVCSVF